MIRVTSERWPELVIFCDTPEDAAYIAKELSIHVQAEAQRQKRRAYWRRKQRESRDRRQSGLVVYEIEGPNWLATGRAIAAAI